VCLPPPSWRDAEVKLDTFIRAVRVFLEEQLRIPPDDIDQLFPAEGEASLRSLLDQVCACLRVQRGIGCVGRAFFLDV
jgi:hypothetical protein